MYILWNSITESYYLQIQKTTNRIDKRNKNRNFIQNKHDMTDENTN